MTDYKGQYSHSAFWFLPEVKYPTCVACRTNKGVLGSANQLLLFYIFQMKASSGDIKIKKEKENGFSR